MLARWLDPDHTRRRAGGRRDPSQFHASEWRPVRFRLDLFHRLNTLTLALPPLRARKEDIPQLVSAFLHEQGRRLGRSFEGVAEESMAALLAHDWPRQRARAGERDPGGRHPVGGQRAVRARAARRSAVEARSGRRSRRRAAASTWAELERRQPSYARCDTRIFASPACAARALLGIHPTLRSRMKRLGIASKPASVPGTHDSS